MGEIEIAHMYRPPRKWRNLTYETVYKKARLKTGTLMDLIRRTSFREDKCGALPVGHDIRCVNGKKRNGMK